MGFAFVHAERDRGRIEALVAEGVERHGFRGIKVHRHDARITGEVCEVARALPPARALRRHGRDRDGRAARTEYPDVDFIIPHLGSFMDDWRAQIAMLDPLVRHPNIYTDSSGVRRFDLLREAVQRAGPHKVLFGSDGPWLHPGRGAAEDPPARPGADERAARPRREPAAADIAHAAAPARARDRRAAARPVRVATPARGRPVAGRAVPGRRTLRPRRRPLSAPSRDPHRSSSRPGAHQRLHRGASVRS